MRSDPPSQETRRTVTVLFCDVADSTALGERLDPESLRSVMSRYFDRMRIVLESHGATVEKFIGDAVMAVFGVPVLHEDDALRAVRAAHEMREALERLNDELERERSVSLEMRIGVNTGPVVASAAAEGHHLVTGDAVNVAKRLEQSASNSEILIGPDTFQLTRDAIEAVPVEPLTLKGKADNVNAYRLISVRPGVSGHEARLRSRMIGRDGPLRTLRRAFDDVVEQATCRLVTVMGSPGIGKSRLVQEFLSTLDGQSTVLNGRCLSYGEGITFWPIAQMAIKAVGVSEDDPPERVREALRRSLAGDPDAEVVAAHLATMLGLHEGGPLEAPWAVRRFVEALARDHPLVAVIDDLQWAEPTLLDVIEHVADWSRGAPILLLCMARPELLEARPAWSEVGEGSTIVRLEPLPERDADSLVENLLGRPELGPEIRGWVSAATQGVPLFVEELLSMLLDEGVLAEKEDELIATVDLATVRVPPAVSALLSARLDRLPAEERALLGAASVVGEVFERSAIRALLPESMHPDLDRALGSLLRKEVVRPSPSDIGRDVACRFRHILLRDASYEAVPKTDRATLHESYAAHLGTTAGERAPELHEFIGYHLEQAHRLRTDLGIQDDQTNALARAASEHLAAAGHRAFLRHDTLAAASLLGRASDLLDPDDAARRHWAWVLGRALVENGELSRALGVVKDALRRSLDIGDAVAAAYAECVLWHEAFQGPGTDVREWETAADRLVSFFEGIGDHRGSALAWGRRSQAAWTQLRFEETAAACERVLHHALAAGDSFMASSARAGLASALVRGPRPLDEAAAFARSTLAEARASGDRWLEAGALGDLARCLAYVGEHDEAGRLGTQSREIRREMGHMVAYWGSAQHTARIALLAGDLQDAADDLRRSCEELESLGETFFLSSSAAMLAEIEFERGDSAEGRRWMELASRMASTDDVDAQTLLKGLRTREAVARGDPDAETDLRELVALADRTDSSLEQAVARLDLARFLGATRRREAQALARRAIDLLEAKGATVYLNQARRFLAGLEAPAANGAAAE